jgi:hypothetical protein
VLTVRKAWAGRLQYRPSLPAGGVRCSEVERRLQRRRDRRNVSHHKTSVRLSTLQRSLCMTKAICAVILTLACAMGIADCSPASSSNGSAPNARLIQGAHSSDGGGGGY